MWKVAGHSLVGTSHLKGGTSGQDHWFHRVITTSRGRKRWILAVADGAGSAAKAEIGAQLTVEFILEQVAAFDGELAAIDFPLAVSWLHQASNQLRKTALQNGARVADYAATLLLGILEDDAGFFLQLGDGGWVVQTPRGIESATWPEDGEYVNETTFLTSRDFPEHVNVALIRSPLYVAGFTDGMQRLFLDFRQNGPHKPMVRKIFSALASSPDQESVGCLVEAFLNSELVNEQVDDDKTLVLAWRNPSPKVEN